MKIVNILIFLFIGINSFAQVDSDSPETKSQITSDKMVYNEETKTIKLIGNVSFKTDIIELEGAEKITFNQETKELVASGFREFTFDGTLKISEDGDKNTLRYKVGESILYLE